MREQACDDRFRMLAYSSWGACCVTLGLCLRVRGADEKSYQGPEEDLCACVGFVWEDCWALVSEPGWACQPSLATLPASTRRLVSQVQASTYDIMDYRAFRDIVTTDFFPPRKIKETFSREHGERLRTQPIFILYHGYRHRGMVLSRRVG